MRIIREGVIPNLEYIFVCNHCGCMFAVSEYELHETNPYINKTSYKCPTCATQVFGYVVQEVEENENPVDDTEDPEDGE